MRLAPLSLTRSYWLATGILLGAGFAGVAWGTPAAIALTAIQVAHFRGMGHRWASLPLQVRAVYLALLVAGLWPPLAFLHVLQCIGAWMNVVADYCPLARLLSLAPWHRREPLTWETLRWTLLSPPAPGSILDRRAQALHGHAAAPVPSSTGALPERR